MRLDLSKQIGDKDKKIETVLERALHLEAVTKIKDDEQTRNNAVIRRNKTKILMENVSRGNKLVLVDVGLTTDVCQRRPSYNDMIFLYMSAFYYSYFEGANYFWVSQAFVLKILSQDARKTSFVIFDSISRSKCIVQQMFYSQVNLAVAIARSVLRVAIGLEENT